MFEILHKFKGQFIKRVEKSQILVLNRVSSSGSEPHGPAKFFINSKYSVCEGE